LQENRFCVIVKQSAAAQQLLFYKERICLQAFRPKTRCPPASGHGLTAVCGRNEALYIQGEFRKRVMRETAWLSVFEKETVIQASGGTFFCVRFFRIAGRLSDFQTVFFFCVARARLSCTTGGFNRSARLKQNICKTVA